MKYREIAGEISKEYEGTPEEIKAMLKAQCTHTGLYDHVALNTGNGVEMVCLRCEKDTNNNTRAYDMQCLLVRYLDKGFTINEVESLLVAYKKAVHEAIPFKYVPDFDTWILMNKDKVLKV